MVGHSVDRILSLLDSIISSYDKLRDFESKGCSKDDLEKELIIIRDTAGEVPSLLSQIFKEDPNQLQLMNTYATLFKMPFVSTLAILIPSIKMQSNPSGDWLKTQSSLAIALMNETVNLMKAVQTFFR